MRDYDLEYQEATDNYNERVMNNLNEIEEDIQEKIDEAIQDWELKYDWLDSTNKEQFIKLALQEILNKYNA